MTAVPTYVCTKCGWIGTDPEPQRNGDAKCPKCPYAVIRVPDTERTD